MSLLRKICLFYIRRCSNFSIIVVIFLLCRRDVFNDSIRCRFIKETGTGIMGEGIELFLYHGSALLCMFLCCE